MGGKPSAGILLVVTLLCASVHAVAATLSHPKVTQLDYEIVNTYPHRDTAFTQGLVFADGVLWEGTGQHGQSSITKMHLENGNVIAGRRLPRRYFGEGITLHNDRVLQLTWKAQTLLVYDAATLKSLPPLFYRGEGWGITHNGEQLIVSDGSARLQFRSADDFNLERTVNVTERGVAVANLNELEWIDSMLLANVWQSNSIVVIDPRCGAIVAKLDLSALRQEQSRHANVLNGIAWRADRKTLLVTGKYWNRLYEIRVLPGLPGHDLKACNHSEAP